MTDIAHFYGSDLSISPSGDLQTCDGLLESEQRVLRRLLTNPQTATPPDYIWHPEYGAGVPSYIGSLIDAQKLQALIAGQMQMETTVAQIPPPVVTVASILGGGLSANIQYTDQASGQPVPLSFSVSN